MQKHDIKNFINFETFSKLMLEGLRKRGKPKTADLVDAQDVKQVDAQSGMLGSQVFGEMWCIPLLN